MRKHGRISHRIRRFLRYNRKQITVSAVIVLLVVSVASVWLWKMHRENSRHVTAGNSVDMSSGYRNVTYKGKKYQYNNLITTVLYAGIDSQGKVEKTGYTNAPRADSISVVVLDKKKKKMTIIAISRDTMTEVRRYSLSGRDRGTHETHLGYAFAYGEGGKVSCENLRDAVSQLLGGIPINEYVVTNQDSMPYINDLVGGVTVKVPNDDLVKNYPRLTKGAVVKLDDSNIRDYLHYRDTTVDFSNDGRVERQRSYVDAYVVKAKEQVRDNPEGTWNKLEDMGDYLLTSVTKNKYLNLINIFRQMEFSDDNFYRPKGENVVGDGHDEFYIDREDLQANLIDIFYEEI